jgi:hypothetical protein
MTQVTTDCFAHHALKMMLVKPELAGTLQTPPGKLGPDRKVVVGQKMVY